MKLIKARNFGAGFITHKDQEDGLKFSSAGSSEFWEVSGDAPLVNAWTERVSGIESTAEEAQAWIIEVQAALDAMPLIVPVKRLIEELLSLEQLSLIVKKAQTIPTIGALTYLLSTRTEVDLNSPLMATALDVLVANNCFDESVKLRIIVNKTEAESTPQTNGIRGISPL